MPATAEAEELLTVKQAAAMLHLDERTVRNHINGHRLPARKLPGGKGWLIRRADLLNTLEGSEILSQANAAVHSGIVEAGTDPRQAAPDASIIRRTHTPEGRARALAALDALLDGDAEEQRRAWEHLQHIGSDSALEFRWWDPETGKRLDNVD